MALSGRRVVSAESSQKGEREVPTRVVETGDRDACLADDGCAARGSSLSLKRRTAPQERELGGSLSSPHISYSNVSAPTLD